MVIYQCGALKGFLDAEGMPLTYIKPHGALYGAGARDETIARAVADAAAVFGVPIMGMAGKAHESAAQAAGVGFIAEYYADLEYDDDGFLQITRKHVAYDPEVAVRRALQVIEEGVAETATGGTIPMRAETVCVHSDTPGAPELAAALATALRGAPSRS
jgi:5-oxoprolinase (ATP-hydrolysing) subunit A